MTNWLVIFGFSFALLVIALLAMAIGWLVTGKSKMHRRCGQKPGQPRDESCGNNSSCELCDPSLGDKRKRMERRNIDNG